MALCARARRTEQPADPINLYRAAIRLYCPITVHPGICGKSCRSRVAWHLSKGTALPNGRLMPMRMTLCVVLVSLAACGVDTATTDTATGAVRVDPTKDLLEPTYVNGTLCKLVFQGALTPQTQTY